MKPNPKRYQRGKKRKKKKTPLSPPPPPKPHNTTQPSTPPPPPPTPPQPLPPTLLPPQVQTRDRNAARITTRVLELNLNAGPIRAQRKSFRPFDDNHGLFGKRVLQAKRFQIVKVFHAIEIDVIDLAVVLEHVDQREGGAGDILFLGGSQSADDSLGQRGLSAAQVSAQQDQHGRAKFSGDFPALRDGFFRGVRDKFAIGHVPTPPERASRLPGSLRPGPKQSAAPARRATRQYRPPGHADTPRS